MMLPFYFVRRFFPIFIGAVAFFSLVIVLIDLLMNLWNYIVNEAPAVQVLQVIALYVPKAAWYSIPLSVLFACSYTISAFYTNNELVAVFASGMSLFKFTLPLLVISIAMSFGLFFFEDNVVVQTYARKQELQNSLLHIEKSLNNDRIVVIAESGKLVYRADFYDDENGRLSNVYFVFRDENNSLAAVIHAPSALWESDKSQWKLQDAVQYAFNDGKLVVESPEYNFLERISEPAETFRNNTVSVEEVTTSAARQYIAQLKRTGMEFDEELSVYYKKYAFPFIVFIAVFLSIGLSGKTRKNVMLTSLASSIGATVLFYVMQMVTMLLAKFGYISAFAGAWFPVIVFVAASMVLLKFART